jgi:hypothetical protein
MIPGESHSISFRKEHRMRFFKTRSIAGALALCLSAGFAMADNSPAYEPTNPTPTPNVKTSEETLTIAGKAYKCGVTEATNETNGMKVASKTWTCNDVPNLLVKSESSTTGTVASKSVMELVKVDAK